MKAILKNGAILPQEPLPKEWPDGTQLEVAKAPVDEKTTNDELDRWMATV